MTKKTKKIIKPGKTLTESKIGTLEKKLLKLSDEEIKELVLDFTKVDAIDAVGLTLILAARNTMTHRDGKFKLINVSDEIFNLFHALHLERHIDIQTILTENKI